MSLYFTLSNFFLAAQPSSSSGGAYRDYQEVKVQEQVQKLDVGKIPRSMWVVLMDDLVDTCKPGDDITVA